MKKRSTQTSTSTRAKSEDERPREAAGEIGLVERYDVLAAMQRERAEAGEPALMTATEVQGLVLDKQATKVTSPEMASLAAKYMTMSDKELEAAVEWDSLPIMEDIRRLAASVLSQTETPRK